MRGQPWHGICALHLPRFEYRHLGRMAWSDRRRALFSGGIGATVSRGEVGSDGQAHLDCLAGEAEPHRTGDHGGNQLGSPHRSAVRAVLQHCGVGGSPESSWPRPEAASFAHGRNAFPTANRSGTATPTCAATFGRTAPTRITTTCSRSQNPHGAKTASTPNSSSPSTPKATPKHAANCGDPYKLPPVPARLSNRCKCNECSFVG